MQAEPLIHWSEPIMEYIGFVAQFVAVGAVGFRFAAVRDRLSAQSPAASAPAIRAEHDVYADATQRAAVIGLIGALVQLFLFARALPAAAARAHLSVGELLANRLPTGSRGLLLVLAVLGLALAATRIRAGWPLALLGVILAPLTGVLTGKWLTLVNPVHRLVAGLWIGTLFILVVAGLTMVLRDEPSRERRGAIVADMVNDFSPLALTCGVLVVLSGLTTAYRHLNPFSSLWTTPYGYALIVKICLVATVFALGAWNWRRMRPALGTEGAAVTVRRSSTGELTAAALVLAASAILVSLPSPRPPKPAAVPGPMQIAPAQAAP